MNKVLDIKKIREVCENIVVLYVEDEEDIRTYMHGILKLFFNNIFVAKDGQNGLEVFKQHSIDLVITDIQMPHMDGLQMIEKIKEISWDIPVIITTAFNEQKYFIRSIDLKVDKYLLKPIEEESAKEVFFSVSTMINNRIKAQELEVRKMQDKINRVSEHIVAEITESYQSPCIVYTDDNIRYINDAFCSLFDSQELEKFLAKEILVENLFDERKDFMKSLNEYDEIDFFKNRISISKRKGRKIYRVIRKEINIDDDSNKMSIIYLFNDITLEEYQKIKIKSYTDILEELVINARYRNRSKVPLTVQNKEVEESLASINKEEVEDNKEKLIIKDDENQLLRRSHIHKTTAEDYVAELDNEILLELQELSELNKDFADSIVLLKEDSNIQGVSQMAGQLEKYAHEISMLFEFADLSYAIRSLSEYFIKIDEDKLDEKSIKKLSILLEGIQSDLEDWNRFIFLDQSAIDIHYLDSSLFSACLQIELIFSDNVAEMESEEDDFELF